MAVGGGGGILFDAEEAKMGDWDERESVERSLKSRERRRTRMDRWTGDVNPLSRRIPQHSTHRDPHEAEASSPCSLKLRSHNQARFSSSVLLRLRRDAFSGVGQGEGLSCDVLSLSDASGSSGEVCRDVENRGGAGGGREEERRTSRLPKRRAWLQIGGQQKKRVPRSPSRSSRTRNVDRF